MFREGRAAFPGVVWLAEKVGTYRALIAWSGKRAVGGWEFKSFKTPFITPHRL